MKIHFHASALLFITCLSTDKSFAQTATAVGAGGWILRTDDGGNSWTRQESGTNVYLYGVSFVDDCTGTVVGEGGTILRTDDCGNSWTRQDAGTSEDLLAVSAVDANLAFAVARRAILRTDDGGANWTLYPVSDSRWCDPGTLSLSAVAFADANTGLAVGTCTYRPRPTWIRNLGMIFRTINGGIDWTLYIDFDSDSLRAVSFQTSADAFAVGDLTYAEQHRYAGRILKGIDGGSFWFSFTFSERLTYPIKLYGVSYAGASNATAVGWDSGSAEQGLILRTTNGGGNWSTRPSGTNERLLGVSFKDLDNGLIVGESGTILRTSDRGESWTPQFSSTGANLSSVSFIDCSLNPGGGAQPSPW